MNRSVRSLMIGAAAAVLMTQTALAQDDEFKVITTFTIIADMARNVAGDAAVVESITKAGAEIHGYEPTPGDIIRAQDADLILWNGLNLERVAANLIQIGCNPRQTETGNVASCFQWGEPH